MADVFRVVIDANIAIAASIRDDPVRPNPVKHRIHDEAAALLARLAESGNGYVVPAVRSEAVGALARAVRDASSHARPGTAQSQTDSEHYVRVERSRIRLDEVLRSLNAVRVDPGRVEHSLELVTQMSESLRLRYNALAGRGLPAPGRGPDPRGARLPPEALQLARFMKKHPNRGDQRVLAEAIALRDSLPAGSRAMAASSDTGLFSPYRHPGGVSDAVTAEIYGRFRIRCDHPEAVLRMIGGAP